MNDNQEKLQKYLASAEDKAVGITEYGTMTIPYAPAEDAQLNLTPLALRKDQGALKDQHWRNPRTPHYLANRYLNMVGYKHADGTPCKAKSPESCPFNQKAEAGEHLEGSAPNIKDQLTKGFTEAFNGEFSKIEVPHLEIKDGKFDARIVEKTEWDGKMNPDDSTSSDEDLLPIKNIEENLNDALGENFSIDSVKMDHYEPVHRYKNEAPHILRVFDVAGTALH